MIMLKYNIRHVEHIKIIIMGRQIYIYKYDYEHKFDYEITKTANKTTKFPRTIKAKFFAVSKVS